MTVYEFVGVYTVGHISSTVISNEDSIVYNLKPEHCEWSEAPQFDKGEFNCKIYVYWEIDDYEAEEELLDSSSELCEEIRDRAILEFKEYYGGHQ